MAGFFYAWNSARFSRKREQPDSGLQEMRTDLLTEAIISATMGEHKIHLLTFKNDYHWRRIRP